MKFDVVQPKKQLARARRLWQAPHALASAIGAVNQATSQNIAPPPPPTLIPPPVGATAFLVGHALGTQGYVCLPTSEGSSDASWTVNQARPEATLFTTFFGQQVQIITHFLSPNTKPNKFAPSPVAFGNATWQSSFDTSKVWAQTQHAIQPSADIQSCPNTGSIACLLLQAIGADERPTGGKLLTQTSFIQP